MIDGRIHSFAVHSIASPSGRWNKSVNQDQQRRQLPDTIFGPGVTEITDSLAELKAQGFQGNSSIEYEANWDKTVPDVAQCVGFVRGWAVDK